MTGEVRGGRPARVRRASRALAARAVRGLRGRTERARASEAGDTLVEVLVTIVIVGIAGVALLGGLLASASAATTGRNIANLDVVLRNFAETASADVQQQLGSVRGTPCSTAYPILGAPEPSSAQSTTEVTAFATGFTPGATLDASFTPTAGGSALPAPGIATASSSGAATITFTPAQVDLSPGSYQMSVSDGRLTSPPVFLAVGATSVSAPQGLPGDTLALTATPLAVVPGAPAALEPCRLDLAVTDSEAGNAASDSMSVVVADLSPFAAPIMVAAPASAATVVGQPASFTFTVAGVSGGALPTGAVSWAPLPAGVSGSCTTTTASPPAAVCQASASAAGTYTLEGLYGGDSNYSGTATPVTLTVSKIPTTMAVVPSASSAEAPATVTFTATVTGADPLPGPTGTVSWSFPAGTPGSPGCPATTLPPGGPYTSTCTVTGAGAGTYQPTATYSGDAAYQGSSAMSPAVVVYGASVSVSGPSSPQSLGAALSFSATVTANGLPPAGSVSWSFPPGTPGSPTCATTTLPLAAPYTSTCKVTDAQAGTFSPVATYNSSDGYSPASGTTTVTVDQGNPTMTATASYSGSTVTFTAALSGTSGIGLTGTVVWAASADGSSAACSPSSSTLPPNSGSVTVSCSLTGAGPGKTYSVTATYSGDSNYSGTAASASVKAVGGRGR